MKIRLFVATVVVSLISCIVWVCHEIVDMEIEGLNNLRFDNGWEDEWT